MEVDASAGTGSSGTGSEAWNCDVVSSGVAYIGTGTTAKDVVDGTGTGTGTADNIEGTGT